MKSDDVSTPAARMIARFGVQAIARWTGRDRSRVHAWTWPKARGGTGGVVPHGVRASIMGGARCDLKVDLAYADFEPQDGESYLLSEDDTNAVREAAQ